VSALTGWAKFANRLGHRRRLPRWPGSGALSATCIRCVRCGRTV